jgi:hypothetical protein
MPAGDCAVFRNENEKGWVGRRVPLSRMKSVGLPGIKHNRGTIGVVGLREIGYQVFLGVMLR